MPKERWWGAFRPRQISHSMGWCYSSCTGRGARSRWHASSCSQLKEARRRRYGSRWNRCLWLPVDSPVDQSRWRLEPSGDRRGGPLGLSGARCWVAGNLGLTHFIGLKVRIELKVRTTCGGTRSSWTSEGNVAATSQLLRWKSLTQPWLLHGPTDARVASHSHPQAKTDDDCPTRMAEAGLRVRRCGTRGRRARDAPRSHRKRGLPHDGLTLRELRTFEKLSRVCQM